MEIKFIKTPQGLVPLDDEEAEKLKRFKNGSVIRSDFSEMRNGAFFKKYWALLKVAYEYALSRYVPMTHMGKEVLPCFDRFRRDLAIMAGYYTCVYNARGELRLEAKSISWAKMSEEEFAQLYSATIDVILQKVLPDVSEDQLKRATEMTLSFA